MYPIKNIKYLNEFGIFQNHTNAKAKDFGKYNLFYGWNGSGKTTFSDIFRCLEKKAKSRKFPSSKFTISINDGDEITQDNISKSNLKIYTFNHDFITENISWDSIVEHILLIDKEKIKERETLETLKKTKETDTKTRSEKIEAIKKLKDAVSTFETNSAQHIKTHFRFIDATDPYYLHYNKRKFEKFINDNLEEIKSNDSLLNAQEIVGLINAAKPDKKPQIIFNKQAINQEHFTKAKEHLDDLLQDSVVSQTIQRLLENFDIKSWVETGLDLHTHPDKNQCEFCGNTITEERKKQLEAHFNDDYKAFQKQLGDAADLFDWLATQYPTLPATSNFYDEFKNGYGEARTALEKAITDLNDEIEAWRTVLEKKIKNPLETGLTVEAISESSVNALNDAITAISTVVGKHNHKSDNFQEETKKAKKKLELHYATTFNVSDYRDNQKEIKALTAANETLDRKIKVHASEVRDIEGSLSHAGIGAKEFNESLHKFLCHSELTLRFNPSKKGYEILRKDSEKVDGNLSEGEKTAIAFVYFITKLKENDNNIEDTIVVVDDPVSSFDSNHLFHAFSFMKKHCDDAKQLFVLTHNFTFFKRVRDWILKKNTIPDQDKAKLYMIEASTEDPRTSTYMDAKPALKDYNSEYHYIFSRLHKLKTQPNLKIDDCFLAANFARKILETFLFFKFPKNQGNFTDVFNRAVKCRGDGDNLEDKDKEKILKFVNEYSHNDVIGMDEDSVENLMGEGPIVISDMFKWIKELDKTHYEDMEKVVKKTNRIT